MGALEQVTQLQNQGMNDSQIIQTLQQQGFSPNTIQNAINQAQVKSAINAQEPQSGEMQPSIMQQENSSNEQNDQDYYTPQAPIPPQANQQPQETTQQQTQDYSYYPQQDQSQQQYYSPDTSYGYGYGYTGGASSDTDTIIEVSEQVFQEQSREIEKQLHILNEFKTLTEAKLENFSLRLKKLEATIDKLQVAILEKVGSYTSGIDSIKKEMSMMQDSFSKLVNKKHK